jgi:hypothetical protein
MDNAQDVDSYINMPSSQNCRSKSQCFGRGTHFVPLATRPLWLPRNNSAYSNSLNSDSNANPEVRVRPNSENRPKWQPLPSMTWLTVIKLPFSSFRSAFPNLLTGNEKPQCSWPQGVACLADTHKQCVETRSWTRCFRAVNLARNGRKKCQTYFKMADICASSCS